MGRLIVLNKGAPHDTVKFISSRVGGSLVNSIRYPFLIKRNKNKETANNVLYLYQCRCFVLHLKIKVIKYVQYTNTYMVKSFTPLAEKIEIPYLGDY